MNDTISRQQVIDAIHYEYDGCCNIDESGNAIADDIERIIDNVPFTQSERKTGRWILDDSELGIKCNKCGKSFSDYINAGTGYMFLEETPNFCPNCGANMRGEIR